MSRRAFHGVCQRSLARAARNSARSPTRGTRPWNRPWDNAMSHAPRTPCRTRRSKCARSWYKASVVTTTTMAARDVDTDGGEPRPRPYLFYVLDALRPLGSAARYALDRFERVVFGRGATPSVRSLQGDLCIG